MAKYTPHTQGEIQQMLAALGKTNLDELYSTVPKALRAKPLNLGGGQTEFETERHFLAAAENCRAYGAVYAGGGTYDHIIPAALGAIVSRQEFLTAYTPYQSEISQGVLQAIFEYQSLMCALTGHEVSNASVYDGATALAEAVAMCCERKKRAIILGEINPQFAAVAKTFAYASGVELEFLGAGEDGKINLEKARKMLQNGEFACAAAACPNYLGIIEDMPALGALCGELGVKFIYIFNPVAAAILKTPAECGADVAVAEGQPLGLPMACGGATLGIMTAKKAMARRLPGRIVGQTADAQNRRCFVLTLQAREQHIRREKASSSICSNQAHNALCTAVYLSLLGKEGLADVARASYSNAHYLAQKLREAGAKRPYENSEFFHEFICDGGQNVREALAKKNILGGIIIGENRLLWCATEKAQQAEMDEIARVFAQCAKEAK